MTHLLDTNTCVDIMKGRVAVIGRLSRVSPSDCAISIISVFDLYSGIEKCLQPVRERPKVEVFLSEIIVIPFDQAAAGAGAKTRAALESVGEPIGPYDTLIAGHALALDLVLVTNNTSEFSRVNGLAIEDWRSAR